MNHFDFPSVQIGKVKFGPNEPVVIIAEGCDNHNGSLQKAKEIAHAAKESGADMIKFQLHLPDEEMHREGMRQTSSEMFAKWGDLYGFIEKNLLKPEEHAELKDYCEKIGIQYFCTPFSLKAAEILKKMGVEGFKIGSGETEDLPFIEKVAEMGQPMMVATGMTELEELDKTVAAIKYWQCPLMLAHCISVYSPKFLSQLKLGTLRLLEEKYKCMVGLSDHTSPEGVKTGDGREISEEMIVWAAIGNGACFIEKHFTLDRSTPDADSKFSHDPETLKKLVRCSREAKEALTAERKIFEEERPVWVWAKRSIVAARGIKAGEIVTREMITSKRPGTGIRSKNYHEEVLGKKAVANISVGKMITKEDLA